MSKSQDPRYVETVTKRCTKRAVVPSIERSRVLCKTLLSGKPILTLALLLLSLIAAMLGLAAIGVFRLATASEVWILFLLLIVAIGTQLLIRLHRVAIIARRPSLIPEERMNQLNMSYPPDEEFVKNVFETIGFMCQINANLIYPTDRLRMLCSLWCSKPLRFEPVLGLALRMKVALADSEIDRIGDRLYEHAGTVRDVVLILSEEFGPLMAEPNR